MQAVAMWTGPVQTSRCRSANERTMDSEALSPPVRYPAGNIFSRVSSAGKLHYLLKKNLFSPRKREQRYSRLDALPADQAHDAVLLAAMATRAFSTALRRLSSRVGGEVAPGGGRLTDLQGLGPKRFYKDVDVSRQDDGTFAVTIDGRNVRTPRRSVLSAPTEPLATALASEWDAQEGRIRPSSMPLTTLVSTAKDIVPEFRERICAAIMAFLHTDTVCIRPAHPSELVTAQDALYTPIIEHLGVMHGIELNVTRGELSAPQTVECLAKAERLVRSVDDYALAALDLATSSSKSLAIAIGLRDAAYDAVTATAAARSEEQWQARVWGEVEGGHDVDDADILVRIAAADALFRFIDLDPHAFPASSTGPPPPTPPR